MLSFLFNVCSFAAPDLPSVGHLFQKIFMTERPVLGKKGQNPGKKDLLCATANIQMRLDRQKITLPNFVV
jgi:hypothetical protein